mmetsp:Transcript_25234/g.66139  ORF Transcript_25234/g.66139 Transcript_25234/m.66139 type:complete len:286 (-) Transcript_25234:420-1277(-)
MSNLKLPRPKQVLFFLLRHLTLRYFQDQRHTSRRLALQLSDGHVAGTAFCSSLAQPDEMHVLDLDSTPSALATLGSAVPQHNLLLSETTSGTPKPQLASGIGTPGVDTSLCLSDRVVGSTGHRGTSLEHHRRFVAALLHPIVFSLLCDANMAVRILVCAPEPQTTHRVEGSAVAIAAGNPPDGDTPWQGHLARRAVGVTTRGPPQGTIVVATPREGGTNGRADDMKGTDSDLMDRNLVWELDNRRFLALSPLITEPKLVTLTAAMNEDVSNSKAFRVCEIGLRGQ